MGELEYLGIVLSEKGGSEMVVRARVKTAWCKRSELAGVIDNKRMPRKVEATLYTSVLKLVLLYGLEACALTSKEEKILKTTEMQMLRRIY